LAIGSGSSSEAQPIPRVTWGDFDGDGLEDLYVLTPGGEDRLYENVGDGTFEDVTEAAGLAGLVASRAAHWGDADADEVQDLLVVAADGTLRLFRNVGGGLFMDHTLAANLAGEAGVLACAWPRQHGGGRARARDAEVEHFGLPVLVDEHVVGLQVAVHDALLDA
jgi:hypothetical protein